MDQKSWHWGKKTREKTILETDKPNLTSKENEEVLALVADKEKLEKELKILNDKFALTLSECNAKDEHMKKQTKIVQEAVAGWEKAEDEMLSMKEHLEESIHLQLIYEERVAHLDCTLKECIQQLHFVSEEQGQSVYDAVMKASIEFDQTRMVLEEKLSETSKRLAKTAIQNSYLNESIIAKNNLTEDLKRQLTQAEADCKALMIRLESIEKDNSSLKYEARVLQKELDIRNEEREYNRRTADVSYKQHSESAKTIAKLESECQRLRLMVRKRLPSPSALEEMKREVEMLGQDSHEMKRKNLNSTGLMFESSVESSIETAMKRIITLTEQLYVVEEENKTLKKSLNRKMNEVQFSRVMLSRTASKLLQLESEIEAKGQVTLEHPTSNLALQELSSASISDIGSFGPSDINLMDDFIEMEKLAVVAVEKAAEISHASVEANHEIIGFSETTSVFDNLSEFSTSNQETSSKDILNSGIPGWFQDVVKVILEQNCVTHKNPDDILEDIKFAMKHLKNPDQCTFDSGKDFGQFDASNYVVDSSSEVDDVKSSSIKRTRQQSQKNLNESIGKMIELIEGISMPADDNNQGAPKGYIVRVFQWKTSDLNDVLHKFLNVCYNLLDGEADNENFATELTTTLEWIINHCFSIQDVSSMEDTIKKQFNWDESSQSENKAKIADLRLELQALKESNRKLEDQIQNDASINKDLDTQLTKTELKEAYHKILELEVELESKNIYCEELDTKYIELQLQLQSMKRTRSNDYVYQKNEPVRTEWEITAASEKLAECQETILNLEKQLKALAATNDVSLFDNIIAAHRRPMITNTTNFTVPLKDMKVKNRPTLLDQMLADDDAKAKVCKASERSFVQPIEKIVVLKGLKGCNDGVNVNSLAILAAKKSGGRSMWKKLLGERRKAKRKQAYQFKKCNAV